MALAKKGIEIEFDWDLPEDEEDVEFPSAEVDASEEHNPSRYDHIIRPGLATLVGVGGVGAYYYWDTITQAYSNAVESFSSVESKEFRLDIALDIDRAEKQEVFDRLERVSGAFNLPNLTININYVNSNSKVNGDVEIGQYSSTSYELAGRKHWLIHRFLTDKGASNIDLAGTAVRDYLGAYFQEFQMYQDGEMPAGFESKPLFVLERTVYAILNGMEYEDYVKEIDELSVSGVDEGTYLTYWELIHGEDDSSLSLR